MNRLTRAAEALGLPKPQTMKKVLINTSAILVGIVGLALNVEMASAATWTSASVSLSDPRPAATGVNYTLTASSVTGGAPGAIRCIKVVVSTTGSGTQAPAGFSGVSATVTAGSSTLVNSTGTNWSLSKADGTGSTGQNNILTYINSTASVTPTTTTGATFVLAGLVNSTTADTSWYYKVNTYNNIDCATSPVDNAIVQFINTNGSTLSLTIDQTLSFTVNQVTTGQACDGTTTTVASTPTTIPFNNPTTAANAVVCQDLTAATNATNGYTVYTRYTGAPTNALGQSIADWSGTNAAPTTFPAAGTEAYGYTTNSSSLGTGTANRFTSPSQNWAKETTSNAEVGYSATGVTTATYRIGHQVGISTTTKPGTYSTTIIYTCTPVY